MHMIFEMVTGFVPSCTRQNRINVVLAKKMSMAEKRKRRSEKVRRRPDSSNLPECKLDFKAPPKPPTASVTVTEQSDSAPERTKAQALLESQRSSVDTLTTVRKAIESLDGISMQHALDGIGYWYIDNLLPFELVSALENEGQHMLHEDLMQQDVNQLGYGEYIAAIAGGEDQYRHCPRSVELVVSTTKHFPLSGLSDSKCMATMRTFDHQVRKAAQQLLTGGESTEGESGQDGSFVVIADKKDDLRQVSMCFYCVPEKWQTENGAGMSFCTGSGIQHVDAKRNRLVVWNSASKVRQEPWYGADGSCIVLHLINASNSQG